MRRNREKLLLNFLLSYGNSTEFLISENQLLKNNPYIDETQLLIESLKKLANENYVDVIYTDRHGEPYYCIQILPKAQNYLSEKKALKRDLIFKLAIAIISATVTFLLGKLLYIIFS